MERVCVFCGSSMGARASYREAAVALGELLVAEGIALVYGGASVGLMGVVADTVLAAGGEVIGVLPSFLVAHEIQHDTLTELAIVETMAERKDKMAELSDGFIALPGGLGTLEELFEMAVWSQLHLHHKPVGVLDIDGYYRDLRAFLDHSVAEQLLSAPNRDLIVFDDRPRSLLDRLNAYEPDNANKWL